MKKTIKRIATVAAAIVIAIPVLALAFVGVVGMFIGEDNFSLWLSDRKSRPEPLPYTLGDTIEYDPMVYVDGYGSIVTSNIIPIEQLPESGMSFRSILKNYGANSVLDKHQERTLGRFPYQWNRLPESVVAKCKQYPDEDLYRYILQNDKDSDSILVLWAFRNGAEMDLLWGLKTPIADFNDL